jgi:hypothetical protein
MEILQQLDDGQPDLPAAAAFGSEGFIGGLARVFEAASGAEVARLDHDCPVYAVAFSPVATAGEDRSARVFEATPGMLVQHAMDVMTPAHSTPPSYDAICYRPTACTYKNGAC